MVTRAASARCNLQQLEGSTESTGVCLLYLQLQADTYPGQGGLATESAHFRSLHVASGSSVGRGTEYELARDVGGMEARRGCAAMTPRQRASCERGKPARSFSAQVWRRSGRGLRQRRGTAKLTTRSSARLRIRRNELASASGPPCRTTNVASFMAPPEQRTATTAGRTPIYFHACSR